MSATRETAISSLNYYCSIIILDIINIIIIVIIIYYCCYIIVLQNWRIIVFVM